ncbi:uncharacterized protein LOC131257569 [Magnolia sinica]|uniref:uncharacterized protein LOC131257569 n=1 Tax=Magnolia sinica TaxID=86752 RepID=UPI00265B4244|nr:uncharacterized protein LOC131257569 [Magnolia sinica]
MKMRTLSEPSPSTRKTALTLSPFLFITLLCIFSSTNKIQFHNLSNITQSNTSIHFQSPPHSTLRLLIGVLTRPDHYERRNLLRLVHGIQSPKNAQVDLKFVFCNLTKEDQTVLVALEIMHHNDIIILNCTENMNAGKTYTYLSSLPNILDKIDGHDYPYDYVMKADDDIYFRLDPLVESLIPLPRQDMYYGFVIPCREMDPIGHYMSGMGYVLSWDLIEWIGSSEIAKNHSVGHEDKVVGEWLQEGGRGKNRYNAKPAMYDYPLNVSRDACSHEFVAETIAVHRLKDQGKWIRTLQYFNVTDQLKPSKMYRIR